MPDFRFRWLISTAPETLSVSIPATGTLRERRLAVDAINLKYGLIRSFADHLLLRARNIGREKKNINPKRSYCRRFTTLNMLYDVLPSRDRC